MPDRTGEGGARRQTATEHGRADYENRADREATHQLSLIVVSAHSRVLAAVAVNLKAVSSLADDRRDRSPKTSTMPRPVLSLRPSCSCRARRINYDRRHLECGSCPWTHRI